MNIIKYILKIISLSYNLLKKPEIKTRENLTGEIELSEIIQQELDPDPFFPMRIRWSGWCGSADPDDADPLIRMMRIRNTTNLYPRFYTLTSGNRLQTVTGDQYPYSRASKYWPINKKDVAELTWLAGNAPVGVPYRSEIAVQENLFKLIHICKNIKYKT